MNALVTGASRRAALTIIRSLGRHGVDVTISDSTAIAPSFFSRYCKHKILYPSPQKDPEGYVKKMLEIVSETHYDVFMPVHDFELIPVARQKEDFSQYTHVPIPDFETLLDSIDKSRTLKIAMENGIPCPKTYFVEDVGEVKNVAGEIGYPAVIKPRTQAIWERGGAITSYVTKKNYVNSAEELIARYGEIHKVTSFPLIQEYAPGRGCGVAALFNHGKPRAAFAYRRLREYPITGGPSTLRESIKDENLVKLALKLLSAMKWHGVAMVEFRVDNGNPLLMEVNGRFWGSLALPVASGVDFPYLLYRMTVDGDVQPVFEYKSGVRCRWLIPGDMLHLLSSLKYGQDRLAAVKEFLKFFDKDLYYDEISLDDPLPALGMVYTSTRYFIDFLLGRRNLSGEYR